MSRFSTPTATAVLLATLVMASGCAPDPIAATPPALTALLTGNATVPAEVTAQVRTQLKQHPDFKLEEIERLDVRQPFADAPHVYSFEGVGIRAKSQPIQHHFIGSWNQSSSVPSFTVLVADQPGQPTNAVVGEEVVGRIAGRLSTYLGTTVTVDGLDTVPLDVPVPTLGRTAFTSRISVNGQPKLAQGYYAADKTIRILWSDLH